MSVLLAVLLFLGQAPEYQPHGTLGDAATLFHPGNVLAVAYFPDGKQIASCTDTAELFVWDAATGALVGSTKPGLRAESLAVTPDGKFIVAGGPGGNVVFIDWPNLKPGKRAGGGGAGGAIVSRSATRAVAQNRDKLDFLDLETGKTTSEAHRHPVGPFPLQLAISPDGELAASADGAGAVRIWKTSTGKFIGEASVAGTGNYIRVAFSGDGKRVVVDTNRIPATVFDAAKPGNPIVWDGFKDVFETADHAVTLAIQDQAIVALNPATRAELGRFDRPGPEHILPGSVSPDHKTVAVVCDHQSLQLLRLPALAEVIPIKGPLARVHDIAIAPKGDRLAAVAADGSLHVWDLATKQHVKRLDSRFKPEPHLVSATLVRWSFDGNSVDGFWVNNYARWNVVTGARSHEGKPPQGMIYRMPSPDGDSVLVANGTAIQRVLPQNDNRVGATFQTPWNANAVAFTPDGSKAAMPMADGSAGLVDCSNGKLLRKTAVKVKATDRILLTPDAETLILVGDDLLMIQLKTGKELRKVDLKAVRKPGTSAQSHAISPDGAVLALSFEKPELLLWSVADGTLTQTLTGPRSMIQTAEFSRDGKWLAAAGWDRAVHVWSRK